VDCLRLKLDDIFLYIDKSQIPSGYLAEYGAEFSPLHFFNGIVTDSNVVGSLDNFRFIYTDVETAKIYPSAPLLQPIQNVNTLIDSSRANGKSALVILAGSYASFKPTALTDGLFNWSRNRLYDIAGRTISPYVNNLLFAAAATMPDFLNTVTLSYDARK
jgi:hypothetical protein